MGCAIPAFVEADIVTRDLRAEIAACRYCAAFLPCRARPVVQLGSEASIVIISQAPGRLVHETGVPWNDASGARLRDWLGLTPKVFYDNQRVALVPMGLCYPGRGTGADLPPRRECAPRWHVRIMAHLGRRRLTLLVGHYAQSHHLPATRAMSVTERVRNFDMLAPDVVALPHPSWRSTGWMQRNPWFAAKIIPGLRQRVAEAIAATSGDDPCKP